MKLEGRVAVVTGGAFNHGRGIAKRLANDGASVVVFDIDGEATQKVVEEINKNGGKALGIAGDISKKADVDRVFDLALEEFSKVDILVQNAATISTKALVDEDEETWDKVFAVNVKGTFLTTQRSAQDMLKRGYGRIIIASSGAGIRGIRYLSLYSATKSALIRMVEAWSRELAPHGITVNAYSPGYSPSSKMGWACVQQLAKYYDMPEDEVPKAVFSGIPIPTEADPRDTAALISFLCSDEAKFITGQMVCVDGGSTGGTEMLQRRKKHD